MAPENTAVPFKAVLEDSDSPFKIKNPVNQMKRKNNRKFQTGMSKRKKLEPSSGLEYTRLEASNVVGFQASMSNSKVSSEDNSVLCSQNAVLKSLQDSQDILKVTDRRVRPFPGVGAAWDDQPLEEKFRKHAKLTAPCQTNHVENKVLSYLKKNAVQLTRPPSPTLPILGNRFRGHNSKLPRSTRISCKIIMNVSVEVTLTNECEVVNSWIKKHFGDLNRKWTEKCNLGLDVEWKPNRIPGSDNKVSLLQLSLPKHALLVQMVYLDKTPQELVALLNSKHICVGGVGVTEDLKKLARDHDLKCGNKVVEVADMAAQIHKDPIVKSFSLKKLAKAVLGMEFSKSKGVTMSNWEKPVLTEHQIHYAAADAWVSLAILDKLSEDSS